MGKKQLLTLALIFLTSCASVEKKMYLSSTFTRRRNPKDLEVSYSFPQRDHFQIAELKLQYNTGYSREKVLRMLKAEAADLGGDGIKIISTGQFNYSWVVNARAREKSNMLKSNARRIKVIVFRYR